jgi:hypothetical protein
VAKNSDVLFVSVKPQYVHTVLSEARDSIGNDTLVISIAAGITGGLPWKGGECTTRSVCHSSVACRGVQQQASKHTTGRSAHRAWCDASCPSLHLAQCRSCWTQLAPTHACAA